MTRRIWILLFVFFSGCSAGIHSSLMRMQVDLSSPVFGLNSDLQVVYPYADRNRSPLNADYGTAWQGIARHYPEYSFN